MSKLLINEPPLQQQAAGTAMRLITSASRLFGPTPLFVQTHDGLLFLTDQGGFIMERAEWLDVRAALDAFYLQTSDAEIAEHNQDRLEIAPWDIAAHEPGLAPPSRPGYVYLMHGVGTPWYKIGKSGKPRIRLNQMSALAPFEIKLIHVHQVDDMDAVEQAFHARFAEKRASGEWFVLTEDDIKAFVGGTEGLK